MPSRSNDRPSILIVGAGPTGLTAALELARLGILPRIIDRKDCPTPLSKAVGISAHSLDILEASGVSPRLLSEGLKIRHAHFHANGREFGVIDFSRLPHRYNFLLSLPQRDTETIMADVLERLGVTVEWGSALTGLEPKKGKVEACFDAAGGNRETKAGFDYVYGADGANSAVRNAMGIGFEGYTHKRQWSIADVEIAAWPYEPGAAQAFLHGNGDVGFIIPIGENRFRAVSNTPDAMDHIPGRYEVSRVLRTDRFHIPIRQATTYQAGRVFLGGDAAHVHSPIGARGMNLGIEDAACFARHAAGGGLCDYTIQRRPVGRRWIALSERILSAAETDSALVQVFRNAILGVVGHLPFLQRPLLERVAGLKE